METIMIGLICVFILFNLRVILAIYHKLWLTRYCEALGTAFLRKNFSLYEREEHKKVADNIVEVLNMYPNIYTMAFSLGKWTRDGFFPNFKMNFALALADRIEDIDTDLIKL